MKVVKKKKKEALARKTRLTTEARGSGYCSSGGGYTLLILILVKGVEKLEGLCRRMDAEFYTRASTFISLVYSVNTYTFFVRVYMFKLRAKERSRVKKNFPFVQQVVPIFFFFLRKSLYLCFIVVLQFFFNNEF